METSAPPLLVRGRFATSRRRLSRRLGVVGYVAIFGAPLVVILFTALGNEGPLLPTLAVLALVSFATCGGPLLLLLGFVLRRSGWAKGTLRVVEGRLGRHFTHDAEGAPVGACFPLGEVVQGVRWSANRDGFELTLANGELLVGEYDGDVDEFLHALGVGPSRRVATMRTSAATTPAYRAYWLYFAMATAIAFASLSRVLLVSLSLFAGVLAWVLAEASRGPEVTVGVDGMRIDGLWGTTFYPWSTVNEVRIIGGALRATLTNGRMVSLGGALGTSAERAAALWVRVEMARVVGSRSGPWPEAATAERKRTVVPKQPEERGEPDELVSEPEDATGVRVAALDEMGQGTAEDADEHGTEQGVSDALSDDAKHATTRSHRSR